MSTKVEVVVYGDDKEAPNVYIVRNGLGENEMTLQLPASAYRGTGVDNDTKHYLRFEFDEKFLDELSVMIETFRRTTCLPT